MSKPNTAKMITVSALMAYAATGVRAQPAPPDAEARPLNEAEAEFSVLHDAYVARFEPLWIEQAAAWWQASITGTDQAFQRRKDAETALVELHSERAILDKLIAFRNGGKIDHPLLRRQLELLYQAYLPARADPELRKRIVALEADADQVFNTHRSRIDGVPRTENEVRRVLAETTNSGEAEKAWTGYMAVGAKTEGKLKELVRLRNRSARQVGFDNYFAMTLTLQEIDEAEMFRLFDELEELTRRPFAELKGEIDRKMAARFGIPAAGLRPWHYGDLFFQEAPNLEQVNLNDILRQRDLVALAETYYASLGLPVDDILARSDLYEKDGKTPHAFCADLNRAGDIRLLCNLQPTGYWMDTLLHELGHAVYAKHVSAELPFPLRQPTHSVTDEGVAEMFGAMALNEDWLRKVLKLPEDQAARFVKAARNEIRAQKIIFSRWAQVMVRFEHGMYTNPNQDLGRLWWDVKERYQLLNPPADRSRPDYGAKMHIIGSPVYYHSYMMGDLFACQVRHHVARNILGLAAPASTSFFGRKEVGDYLRSKIFAPGKRMTWDELIRSATEEPLTPKYFARMYLE